MKKCIIVFVVLFVICSMTTATAESYKPFDMTLTDFCIAYNAQPAPLGATVAKLGEPTFWGPLNEYDAAIYYADTELKSDIALCALFNGNADKSLDKPFVALAVLFKPEQLAAGIAITKRCLDVFEEPVFTIDVGSYAISEIISNYYLNHYEQSNMVSYWEFGDGLKCEFFKGTDGYFYFDIYRG